MMHSVDWESLHMNKLSDTNIMAFFGSERRPQNRHGFDSRAAKGH